MVEYELLLSKNLALDHLRAFSVSDANNVSKVVRFSWICFKRSLDGFWLFLWYKWSRSFVRDLISASLDLFLIEAIFIRWPLITALCAILIFVGDMSGVTLCAKYYSRWDRICWLLDGSVSKESFIRHEWDVLARPIREVLKEIIWWSDQGHAWISALEELASRIGVQKM